MKRSNMRSNITNISMFEMDIRSFILVVQQKIVVFRLVETTFTPAIQMGTQYMEHVYQFENL